MTNKPDGFTCLFCGHVFKREHAFIKHQCAQMIRDKQLKSPTGRVAYLYYSKWLHSFKRGTTTMQTFGTSKHFSAFYKFVEWKRKVKIPDVDLYLRLMIRWRLDPNTWMLDKVYSKYIEYIDRTITVEDHLKITFNTILDISKAAEIDKSQVFDVLEPYMVIEYIRARKLSPWVLIKINNFKTFYARLNESDKYALNDVMRPKFWMDYIKEKPEETNLISEFIQMAKL